MKKKILRDPETGEIVGATRAPFLKAKLESKYGKESASSDDSYKLQLQQLVDEGWEVASEGPSGAQLKKVKKVRIITMLCIAVVVPAFLFSEYEIGVVALVLGGLNHFLTKEQKKFLPK